MLQDPRAWDLLPAAGQEQLLSLARPEDITTDFQGRRSLKSKFLESEGFAHAVASHQDDVRCGRLDPEWQAEAFVAHKERAAGKFAKFEKEKLKKDWNIDPDAESYASYAKPDASYAAEYKEADNQND